MPWAPRPFGPAHCRGVYGSETDDEKDYVPEPRGHDLDPPSRGTTDREAIKLALDEAAKCVSEPGKVSPKVGAVVVRGGRVPLDAATLARASRDDAHLMKLVRKHESGFLEGVRSDVIAALSAARSVLVEACS